MTILLIMGIAECKKEGEISVLKTDFFKYPLYYYIDELGLFLKRGVRCVGE